MLLMLPAKQNNPCPGIWEKQVPTKVQGFVNLYPLFFRFEQEITGMLGYLGRGVKSTNSVCIYEMIL